MPTRKDTPVTTVAEPQTDNGTTPAAVKVTKEKPDTISWETVTAEAVAVDKAPLTIDVPAHVVAVVQRTLKEGWLSIPVPGAREVNAKAMTKVLRAAGDLITPPGSVVVRVAVDNKTVTFKAGAKRGRPAAQ